DPTLAVQRRATRRRTAPGVGVLRRMRRAARRQATLTTTEGDLHGVRTVRPLPALPGPALVPRRGRRQSDESAVPVLPPGRAGDARDVPDGGPFAGRIGTEDGEWPIAGALRVARPIRSVYEGGCSLICTLSMRDRKSTRLNSSHVAISYAVFCLK